MASIYNYAGVIVKEQFPQAKKEASGLKGRVVLIGVTRKGKKDEPISVKNYKEFLEKCGSKITGSELHYNVYAAFKEGASDVAIINPLMDNIAIERDNDKKAIGGIFQEISKVVTTVANIANFSKASVLYNSNVVGYADYVGGTPIGVSSVSDIDLSSFRVLLNGIVIGKSDEDGNIVPVFDYQLANGTHFVRVKSGSGSLIDLTIAQTDAMTANVVSVTLEEVAKADGTLTALTTQLPVTINYVLNNLDDTYQIVESNTPAKANDAGVSDTFTFNTHTVLDTTNYASLTISDIALESLTLTAGVVHYYFKPTAIGGNSGELIGDNATTVDGVVITFSSANKLIIQTTEDEILEADMANISVSFKVNVATQIAYYKDRSIVSVGNPYYTLTSRYEADEYNKLILRVFSKDDYNDDKGNTVYIESDVYERQYTENGTEVDPLLVEDLLRMSFKTTDSMYFIDAFNDEEKGCQNMVVDKNTIDDKVPFQVKNIGSGVVNPDSNYIGKYTFLGAATVVAPSINLLAVKTLQNIVKGSVTMELRLASNSSLISTYKDNGIGGFYNISDRMALSGWSINYETGIITSTISLIHATDDRFLSFSFAQKNIRTYVDYSLSRGVGGTETQASYMNSGVLTDSVLEKQGRGIYAIEKLVGEFVVWGIPDLSTNYDIALACMQYIDGLDVKSQLFIWNMDDSLSEVEVGNYMKNYYKYRTKNALVMYPKLNVEDFDTQRLVPISFIGTVAGKIANKVGTRQPHISIAGKLNGKINWGVSPTRKFSIKQTADFNDFVNPVITSYDTGFVIWGDNTLADTDSIGFETISHSLVFNVIQFEAQSLLWDFAFMNINDSAITQVKSALTSYLIAKAELGWYGTEIVKGSFEVDMSENNEKTAADMEIYAKISFKLPNSAKRVILTVSRKF